MIFFIAGLLTVVLLLNALLLILLVLVQLPKKDAGAGLAFGGGTADALFGAGSGNALTKITKWATGIFVALAIVLGVFQDHLHRSNNSSASFLKDVSQQQMQSSMPAAAVSKPAAAPANNLLSGISVVATNASTLVSTNSAK